MTNLTKEFLDHKLIIILQILWTTRLGNFDKTLYNVEQFIKEWKIICNT